MSIMLAISGRPPFATDSETITIGTEPGSMIAFLGDKRIKPRHAQIRRVAGRWMVEAREAESLRVGSAAPAPFHWLNPGDVIYLVENGPVITFEPPLDEPISLTPTTRTVAKPSAAATPSLGPTAGRPIKPPTSAPAASGQREAPGGSEERLVPPPFSPLELADLQTLPAREKPRVRPLPKLWSEPKAPAVARASVKTRAAWVPISIGVTVLVTVVAAFVWLGGSPSVDDSRSSAVPDKKQKVSPALADDDEPDADDMASENGTHAPAIRQADKPPPVSVERPALAELQHSLYAVLVHDAENKNQFRLGTAWAVAPRRLVTSGAVIVALEELLKSGVTIFVSPASHKQEIRVTGIRVHPRFRQAADEATAARNELEALSAAARSTNGDGSASASQGRVQAARDRLAGAYASEVEFDLGMLETGQFPAQLLPWESGATPVAADEQFILAGLPFSINEYRSPGPSNRAEEREGTVVATDGGGSAGALLTIRFPGDVVARNWSGSPLLNAAGAVVGVYSRPMEPPDDAQESDKRQSTSHAVTPILRLREFVPDLK